MNSADKDTVSHIHIHFYIVPISKIKVGYLLCRPGILNHPFLPEILIGPG